MKNFVVLSSSRGTTFEATMDARGDDGLTMPCLGLLTNEPDADCISRASRLHVPVSVVQKQEGEKRAAYDRRLHQRLLDMGATVENTVLACMGFMRILGTEFLDEGWNALNVHPSLLPKHKGLMGDAVHAAVIQNKETESGMTIHALVPTVDEGPIILQKSCIVLPEDTIEDLRNRVQALERDSYWRVLEDIYKGRIDLKALMNRA